MTEGNLKYWDKLRTPPKDALKSIRGGRLKGMTDINPAWRIKAMTETFGPCGTGWKWNTVKKWTEQGSDGQVLVFVDVELFIKDSDGAWSEAIPGSGGSKLIVKESSGLFTDDEAYKKATTDALSTAMKMVGVAADIYMGNDDGSKYKEPVKRKELMRKDQSDALIKFCTAEQLNPQAVAGSYGITKSITADTFDNIFRTIKSHVESGDLGYRFAIPEGESELKSTPEWAKYKEACDIAPDIAGTMPEPSDATQCLAAASAIKKAIDAHNK